MDKCYLERIDLEILDFQNLKYWRFRMYLLPKEHPATKRIIDPSAEQPTEHCDIYLDGGAGEAAARQYTEDFVRFMEIHMNKIKKLNCHKLARVRQAALMLLSLHFEHAHGTIYLIACSRIYLPDL